MKLKFTGSAGGYVVVDPGEYRIRIEDATEKEARASGEEVIEVRLRILSDGPFSQSRIPHSWSLQPSAIWRLENDLWGLGLLDEKMQGQGFELDSSDILKALEGTEAFCQFYTEPYLGQDRSKVVVNSFALETKSAKASLPTKAPLGAQSGAGAPPPERTSPIKGKKAPF